MKNMSKSFRFVVNACRRPNARPRPTVSNSRFNEQTVTDRISVLFKSRRYAEALEEFDFVQKSADFPIRISSYAYLICACSSLRSLELGRRVHGHMVASNCEPDIILRNHIVNMYGKCGSLEDARKVFDEMPQRNVVSWTALIAGYVQNGRDGDAVKLYLEMLQKGLVPDGFTFGSILRACSGLEDVGLGRQVHAHVLKSQFGSHQIAQNALISMYTKLDQIEAARDVFSRIESKDLISWGSIISGFCKHGHELEALSQFREMLRHGVHEPNEVIFGNAFNACRSLQQPEYGRQVHGVCIKFGFGRDPFAGCSICDMYAKCGYIDSASTAFHGIANPDLVSWNAMISGLVNHGKTNEATSLFSQMMQSGLTPDEVTVLSLLCAFTNPSLRYHGMLVHSYIIKMGFNLKVWVCNALITMYLRCSSFHDAYNLFNEIMHIGDLGTWDTILSACAKHKHILEVFRLFKLMLLLSKVKPDHSTLTIVLGAHSDVASLEVGNQIHCYTIKTGLSCDVSIMNILIDMYMKCGSLGNARRLFDSMKNPDIVSWSSLIMGYTQFGHGQEALELYRTMRSLGITPNEVTIVGVLTACNHAGFVEEGCKLYRTMETELGITPTREHCSCVVDMLARSGYVKEAEAFITQFPFDPDIVVWKTLLAACRAHKQVEIGERAVENILNINPSDSDALVLLSDIYAGCNRWEDVARLRSAMKQRGVKKVRGQSWIEVKDRVHVFVAKDELHPEKGNIYGMLDNGYVPFHNQPACEHKFTVDLPKKHGRGGQSALRFARLRMEKRHNYVRKTAELATQFFINPATSQPNVSGLILAGSADFKTELSQSDMFDQRLQAKILNVVDVSYGGENGFNQAIELSSEILANVKFIQEKRLIGKYFEEISQDTGKYVFGIDDTLKALDMGAVETLIVWENLDINRFVLKNSTTGEIVIKHLNKEQEADQSNFRDAETSAELEVQEKLALLEWFANEYKRFGCTLEFVTNKSQEGSQFCRGFGGIGGILRYQLDMRTFDDLSDGEVYEDSD